jgi:hypothetical protein
MPASPPAVPEKLAPYVEHCDLRISIVTQSAPATYAPNSAGNWAAIPLNSDNYRIPAIIVSQDETLRKLIRQQLTAECINSLKSAM